MLALAPVSNCPQSAYQGSCQCAVKPDHTTTRLIDLITCSRHSFRASGLCIHARRAALHNRHVAKIEHGAKQIKREDDLSSEPLQEIVIDVKSTKCQHRDERYHACYTRRKGFVHCQRCNGCCFFSDLQRKIMRRSTHLHYSAPPHFKGHPLGEQGRC